MISHVIATFSSKPVFGLGGPHKKLNISFYATHYMRKLIYNLLKYWYLLVLITVVHIYLDNYNSQVTNLQCLANNIFDNICMLFRTSEPVRVFSMCLGVGIIDDDLKIRQWIAGVTDGDGNLYISKLGYVEYSVVMESRDIACLHKLQAR